MFAYIFSTEIESPDVFTEIISPLEEIGSPLDTTWGLAKTLYLGNQSLMPTKCYLNIHDRAKNARGSKYFSKPIYEACKKAKEDPDLKLTEEERRIVAKFTLEGKLNGAEVKPSNRDYFEESVYKIQQRQTEFSQKLEVRFLRIVIQKTEKFSLFFLTLFVFRFKIATKQFNHLVTDPGTMKDFPEEFLKTVAVDPTQPTKGPWKVNLQPHIKNTYLGNADSCEITVAVFKEQNHLTYDWVKFDQIK